MNDIYNSRKRKIQSLSFPEYDLGHEASSSGRTTPANVESRERRGRDGGVAERQFLDDGRASSRSSNSRLRDQGLPSRTRTKFASSSPGQHLCASCSSIDFDSIQPGPNVWNNTALKLGTLSQFTVDPDCFLCQLFASMASLAYAPNNSDSITVDDITFYLCSFYTSAMYSHNWRNSRNLRGLDRSVSFAVIDEHVLHDNDDSFTKERKMSHALWPSRTSIERSGWLSPTRNKNQESKFAAMILMPQADLNVPKRWLDYCLEHHGKTCEPTDTRPIPSLRVVDCRTGLIVSAQLGCKYLAMSYVWGTAPSKELEEGRSLLASDTPILIYDAISATKSLGYRFLWIDRYCIPQEEGKERHSQIQQMDLVYSRAQATIIAISSPDPNYGLPGVGNKKRSSSVTIKIGNELHTYVPPHPTAEIYGSVWNSRGWTHQETILSRRRIFFCKHQIYFECSGMRCQDTMHAPLDLLHASLKDAQVFSKWNRPGLFSRVRPTPNPLSTIFDHITIYSRRNLTRPDDILNGIMGTFHAFESIYDTFRHYMGIPMVHDNTYKSVSDKNSRQSTRTEQFLTGLCWHLSSSARRRPGFPSWSWAGWHGHLKPHIEQHGYVKNKYGVKVWINSIFESQMDLGTFCDATSMEVFPKNPEPFVLLEADFFDVRFCLAVRDPSKAASFGVIWEAVFEDDDKELFRAPFHITKHTSVDDELHIRMLETPWRAFVLGDRLKTLIHAGTKRKILSNESPHAIIIVVDEIEKGLIERIGMIEIDDPKGRARLDDITKHRRICRYG